MNIKNISFKNIQFDKVSNPKNVKQGKIIKAKILDVSSKFITLDLGKGNILKGKLDGDFIFEENSLVSFLVKESNDSNIILTPIDNSNSSDKANNKIQNILYKMNLKASKENIKIIKSLIKYKMPITKNNINHIKNAFKKITSIVNIKEDELLYTINNKNTSINEVSIDKILKHKLTNLGSTNNNKNVKIENHKHIQQKLLSNDNATNNDGKTSDSSKTIFSNKTTNTVNNTNYKELNITDDVMKKLNNTKNIIKTIDSIVGKNKFDMSFIDKISFLVKNDIKISINNIKFLNEILEDKKFFKSTFKELSSEIKDSDLKFKFEQKINDFIKEVSIKFNSDDKNKLKNYYKKVKQFIEEMEEQIQDKQINSDKFIEKAKTLKSKVDFMNKLNNNMTFVYIPLMDKKEISEKLYFLNKNKKKNNSKNMKIFISLNTINMKKVEVLCELYNEKLKINFNLENESLVDLFKNNIKSLKNQIINNGFEKVSFNYSVKDDVDILNLISEEEQSNYILDVRV